MVDLVLESFSHQVVLRFDANFLTSFRVYSLREHLHRSENLAAETGHRQASFVNRAFPGTLDYFWIDQRDRIVILRIDHDHSQRHSDLWRGQADAWRVVHGFPHIFDQFVDAAVDRSNAAGLFAKDGAASTDNPEDGQDSISRSGLRTRMPAPESVNAERLARLLRRVRVLSTLSR